MEPEHHIANLCTCLLSARKMADGVYGHPKEGELDLCNGAVLEKTPQIF